MNNKELSITLVARKQFIQASLERELELREEIARLNALIKGAKTKGFIFKTPTNEYYKLDEFYNKNARDYLGRALVSFSFEDFKKELKASKDDEYFIFDELTLSFAKLMREYKDEQ